MYQLRVQFTGYWKPPLWRRVEMPSKAKLQDLHYAIVAVLGWSDSHLHIFGGEGFQVHMPSHKKAVYEDDTHYSEDKVTLQTVFTRQGNEKLLYIYDFGQNWRLTVEVKKAYYAEPGNLMRCSGGKCAIPSEHGPTGDEVEADDYIEFDPFAPTPPWDSKAEDMLAINAKLADRSSLQMLE